MGHRFVLFRQGNYMPSREDVADIRRGREIAEQRDHREAVKRADDAVTDAERAYRNARSKRQKRLAGRRLDSARANRSRLKWKRR